jgi:hypothetical protein
MELDLQSLFGLHVHSCISLVETMDPWMRLRTPPPLAFGLIYKGVSQDRRHLSLQRRNTENFKQIFQEKELRHLIPNFQYGSWY